MKKIILILLLYFISGINAQNGGLEGVRNPDKDVDFKIDATEMKYWSGDISYYFSRGYAKTYFGVKLASFVRSFDENKDGKLSNLEFRRFQSGAKKLFAEAYDIITLKYDENKNKRLDKEEKEAARVEVSNFLDYALSVGELQKDGVKVENILNKDRAIDDIYN